MLIECIEIFCEIQLKATPNSSKTRPLDFEEINHELIDQPRKTLWKTPMNASLVRILTNNILVI